MTEQVNRGLWYLYIDARTMLLRHDSKIIEDNGKSWTSKRKVGVLFNYILWCFVIITVNKTSLLWWFDGFYKEKELTEQIKSGAKQTQLCRWYKKQHKTFKEDCTDCNFYTVIFICLITLKLVYYVL